MAFPKDQSVHFSAQLVISDHEAYVAYSLERKPSGPSGETQVAHLIHTNDGGITWHELSWQRSPLSHVKHWGYPTWPPEVVSSIEFAGEQLTITHRDEWVPHESGGESLWLSTLTESIWTTQKIRPMDYEDADAPATLPAIQLALPSTIQQPI
jgi:hypothetical protein